jgi:chromate transporter
VAIFLPAFVFVALSAPFIPKLRQSKIAGGALDGVNLASLALMATVTWQLGRGAVTDFTSLAVVVVSFAALVHWRVNATWLILAGALIGLLR